MTYFLFFVSLGGMVATVYKDSVPLAIVAAAVFVGVLHAGSSSRIFVIPTQPNNNKENTNEQDNV
jgi:hypothetical protein